MEPKLIVVELDLIRAYNGTPETLWNNVLNLYRRFPKAEIYALSELDKATTKTELRRRRLGAMFHKILSSVDDVFQQADLLKMAMTLARATKEETLILETFEEKKYKSPGQVEKHPDEVISITMK